MSFGIIDKIFSLYADRAQDLEQDQKLKILFFCSMQIVIATTIIILVMFIAGAPMYPAIVPLGIITLIYILVSYLIWRWRALYISNILFHSVLLVIIPARLTVTGGVDAPLMFTYISQAILVFVTVGKRAGVLACLFFSVCILGFGILESRGVDFGSVAGGSMTRGVILSVILCYIILPVFFVVEGKERMRAQLKKNEQSHSGFLIMRRLNHEIGNSLNVALGFLEIAREENNIEMLKVVKKNVYQIEEMINQMSAAASRGDLVDVLETNKDAIVILEELKKRAGI